MQKGKIYIEEYEVKGDTVAVQFFKKEWTKCQTVYLSVSKFEDWLIENNKLKRTLTNTETFETEYIGEMPFSEYWGVHNESQKSDMLEYIGQKGLGSSL